jgi:hypothetical protein
VGQRLAPAIGGVIAALACAVALPAHAQAATVAWSTQKPPGSCGPARSISTGSGYANIRDCLKIARSASGTYYYNGVLEVDYHRAAGYVGDVLGGKSMIARVGDKYALGVNDCPRQRWINDQTLWCYSPTKTGQRIYGKGVLLNNAGRWYPPVWSKVTPSSGSCPSNPGPGTAVTRWYPVVVCVLRLLGQPTTPTDVNNVFIIISSESAGKPRAINRTDRNAKRGDPSRGLMQTIGATFRAHRSRALPDDIYDPAANIYAGLRYGIARYGSISNIPGVRSVNGGGRYRPYSLRQTRRLLNCGRAVTRGSRLTLSARAITCRDDG